MSDLIYNEIVGYEKNKSWKKIAIHDDTKICGFFDEYRFLSNMHICSNGIWWKKNKFPSTENAYQSAKFDNVYALQFINCSPIESKKLATKLYEETAFDGGYWAIVKYNVMSELIFQKFNLDPTLGQMLLETEDKYLEETNWWHDTDWGVCNGKGENNLGKILMKVRTFLKS